MRLHASTRHGQLAKLQRAQGSAAISEAALRSCTLPELKELCRGRSLPVSGTKMVLQKRLREAGVTMEPSAVVQDGSETASSKEGDAEEEFTQAERELLSFTTSELKQLCAERGLASSGNKKDLVRRIAADQTEKEVDNVQVLDDDFEKPVTAERSKTDQWVEALRRDEFDVKMLEDLFNIQMPQPGDVVTGVVTTLVEWGAFIELDDTGWHGLVHISEVSDEFIDNIEDYLQPGMKVSALVIKSPNDRLDRLALSIRRLKSVSATSGATATDVATSPLFAQRVDSTVRETEFNKIKARVQAIETLLVQLGHGQALRKARFEAEDGQRRLDIPSVEDMLDGIPDPDHGLQQLPSKTPASAPEREITEIDRILSGLLPESSGNSNAGDTESGGTSTPTMEAKDGLQLPRWSAKGR